MWWTAILKFVTSKQGMIVVGVFVVLTMFAGFKWKISSLEGQLERSKAENATMQIRNKLCQTDLGMLKNSVDRQNNVIDQLKIDNDILEEDATRRATEAIRTPEEVEVIVNSEAGPVPMNEFLSNVFGGGVQ